jgi:hypothetical protein
MSRIRKSSARQKKENLKDTISRRQQRFLMCHGKLYITGTSTSLSASGERSRTTGLRRAGLSLGAIIGAILFLQFLT